MNVSLVPGIVRFWSIFCTAENYRAIKIIFFSIWCDIELVSGLADATGFQSDMVHYH